MSDEQQDIEQIRKKKIDSKKAEEQLKSSLRIALEEAAYDRIMNISVVNKELFLSASNHVLRVFQRVGRKVSEAELIKILSLLKSQGEKQTSITFHKK